MSERPILFGAPMVRAILAGKKTQTRRVVKFPRFAEAECVEPLAGYPGEWTWFHEGERMASIECPYGEPGDTLWVREAWCYEADPVTSKTTARVLYRATDTCDFIDDGDGYPVENKDGTHRSPWKSPLHMPRSASRLTLLVKSVRVERLQEISYEDMDAEGVEFDDDSVAARAFRRAEHIQIGGGGLGDTAERVGFAELWDSINGARAPWASNPWVWVVEFERALDGAKERGDG